jgi:A/G-specific adenine glycosylase
MSVVSENQSAIPVIFEEDLLWMRHAIQSYFVEHGRNYPWRDQTNAYLILNTELILQRTKADDVASHWEVIKKSLSSPRRVRAAENTLNTLFQRLGLMKRKKWILDIANIIKRPNLVPNTLESLRQLPGVGFYTACATLAFAFNKNEGLVDANVIRLFERFWKPFPHHDLRQKVRFWLPVSKQLGEAPDLKSVFWGLLDLSGQICTSRAPKCEICPLVTKCRLGRENMTNWNTA